MLSGKFSELFVLNLECWLAKRGGITRGAEKPSAKDYII